MKALKMELMPFHIFVFSGSHQLFSGERELTKASKSQLHFFLFYLVYTSFFVCVYFLLFQIK